MSIRTSDHRCDTSWIAAALLLTVGCLEPSPYETDLPAHERNQTEHNLRLLSAKQPRGTSFRFAVISDSHQFYEELCALVDTLNARGDLTFVMHLGDMAQAGLRQEYQWTLDCLRQLQAPSLTAVGNHDLISNGASVYQRMFGPFEYTFEVDTLRFVVFNGNYVEVDRDPNDIAWLTDATRPSDKGVVLFAHQIPPARNYEALLAAHRVTAQFTGHYHVFKESSIGEVPAYEAGVTSLQQWLLADANGSEIIVQFCIASSCFDAIPE